MCGLFWIFSFEWWVAFNRVRTSETRSNSRFVGLWTCRSNCDYVGQAIDEWDKSSIRPGRRRTTSGSHWSDHTHVFPLEEGPSGYEMFDEQEHDCIQIILKPNKWSLLNDKGEERENTMIPDSLSFVESLICADRLEQGCRIREHFHLIPNDRKVNTKVTDLLLYENASTNVLHVVDLHNRHKWTGFWLDGETTGLVLVQADHWWSRCIDCNWHWRYLDWEICYIQPDRQILRRDQTFVWIRWRCLDSLHWRHFDQAKLTEGKVGAGDHISSTTDRRWSSTTQYLRVCFPRNCHMCLSALIRIIVNCWFFSSERFSIRVISENDIPFVCQSLVPCHVLSRVDEVENQGDDSPDPIDHSSEQLHPPSRTITRSVETDVREVSPNPPQISDRTSQSTLPGWIISFGSLNSSTDGNRSSFECHGSRSDTSVRSYWSFSSECRLLFIGER